VASCSGRDSLCNSVLNDEYILSPDINPDDGGYVTHKKNIYEEALHRTEEERHEYDFHLEAISRTIAVLEPLSNKIAQIPTIEERNAYKLKPNLGGVLKSIHQRVLKKIYGREAGMEVISAMQDIPANAIPIVLQRLRHKEEEWRRAQREWNKIWREVDKRNYYKSLDHQGISFKAQDKKMTSSRFFISEIEAARDEERFKRASFIDPSFKKTRPAHHLEIPVEDFAVLCDTLKLCLSYFDRVKGQYHQAEQEKMEYFLRSVIPTLLDFDPSAFDPTNNANGPETVLAANNGIYEKDLRKRLLKNEQAKSSTRTRDGARTSRSTSRHQSPAARLNEPLSADEPLLVSARPSKGSSSNGRDTLFYADSNFYVCLRQIMVRTGYYSS
jgi:paired amphipathic helix protein Sin3a